MATTGQVRVPRQNLIQNCSQAKSNNAIFMIYVATIFIVIIFILSGIMIYYAFSKKRSSISTPNPATVVPGTNPSFMPKSNNYIRYASVINTILALLGGILMAVTMGPLGKMKRCIDDITVVT